MAAKLPLKIDIGSHWTKTITWKPNGVRANLTGWTARMHIRDQIDGVVLLALTSQNARIKIQTVPDGESLTQGVIFIEILATDTVSITESEGVYDLELIPPTGEAFVRRLLQGKVTFSREVTRDG